MTSPYVVSNLIPPCMGEATVALIAFCAHPSISWLQRQTRMIVLVTIGGWNPASPEKSFSERLSGIADNVSSCDLLVDDR